MTPLKVVQSGGPIVEPASLNASRHTYDYIFAGAGCAGLSLLMRLLQHKAFSGKKILLLDSDSKQKNDRTWCFWEKGTGFFEPIVYHRWNDLSFHASGFSKRLNINPYTYKLIRGIDFYRYCFDKIRQCLNVDWVQEKVEAIENINGAALVHAGGKRYEAPFVFNSIPPQKAQLPPHRYWLLQHFKGWLIETEQDHFDPAQATLMDFRVEQDKGTTFVYVLPFTKRKALVEYTLFSKELLPPAEYDAALKEYLHHFLQLSEYRVVEEEFGTIPMTNVKFRQRDQRVLYIGTAGGNTKASSGYTFRFIQKNADAIMDSMLRYGHPFSLKKEPERFRFYDSVLLRILAQDRLKGADVFAQLFKRNKAAKVLRFLDNETSFPEEFILLNTVQVIPFTRAALESLFLELWFKNR